jgi:diguanylate cyclase
MGETITFPRENASADGALRFIRTLGLKPEPVNYAVWFTYCAGESLDLKAEVDGYLKSRQPFTPNLSEQMFAKYIADALSAVADQATRQKLDDANDRLAKTLSTVLSLVAAAGQGGEIFAKALAAFRQEVASVSDPRLSGAIAAMVTEAEKLANLNRKLNAELTGASNEISALRNDLSTIRQEAYTDGLTGIANRRAFNKRIGELMAELRAKPSHLCLLMTDIDHFKKFNDTFGHVIGDQVIKVVAKTLSTSVRDIDFAARYGGEEFAVLFPKTRLADAVSVAEKIRATISARNMQNRRTGEDLGKITLSIGVSEYAIGESTEQFVERADTALYMAKQTGRNKVCSQLDLPKR